MRSSRQNRQAERPEPLLESARSAAGRAHCPYSRFPVGAAVLTGDGQVFEGSNVENASYGLAMCAERVAIFNAVSAGARSIRILAVSCPEAPPGDVSARMPCGACRQVLAEFAASDLEILVDEVGRFRGEELLPMPFRLNHGRLKGATRTP